MVDDLKFYMQVANMSDDNAKSCYQHMKQETWVLAAYERHEALFSFTTTDKVRIILLHASDGVIGKMVKLLAIIADKNKQFNLETIDSNSLFINFFPHGFKEIFEFKNEPSTKN
jgi:hypothetical protein